MLLPTGHYCSGLWANALAALVMWLHNLDVAPSWDRPWLQSSLADFWGHRWNLPAAASLKTLVYEPIAEGCWVKQQGSSPGAAAVEQNGGLDTAANDDGAAAAAADAAAPAGHGVFAFRRGGRQQKEPAGAEASTETTAPPPVAPQALPKAAAGYDRGRPKRPSALRRAAATCATFLISGLLHEALLWYVTGAAGRPQRYKQLVYFTMQGPMLLVEGALKKAAGKAGVSLPRWASIPLASLTLQLSGYTLFWGAWFDSLNAMDVAAKVKPLAGMA